MPRRDSGKSARARFRHAGDEAAFLLDIDADDIGRCGDLLQLLDVLLRDLNSQLAVRALTGVTRCGRLDLDEEEGISGRGFDEIDEEVLRLVLFAQEGFVEEGLAA